jgi:predicted flap endonuclease-1-like 5' DNA nuclease
MDPVLGLAILSLGAFVGVLVTAAFYVSIIRPRILDETEETPPSPRPIDTTRMMQMIRSQAGGAGQYDELRTTLDDLVQTLEGGQALSSQKLDDQMARLREINDRLGNYYRQFDSVAAYLSNGIAAQDNRLSKILTQLDQQRGLLTNSNAILEDLKSTSGLAALAGRLTSVGEQVNTLADQLLTQEALIREIHTHTTPSDTDDSLYRLLGHQGATMNDLAGRVQAFDEKLGGARSGGSDLTGLGGEFEDLRQSIAALKTQLASQETAIRRMFEEYSVNKSVGDVLTTLREHAHHLGKLDARIDEQTDLLTRSAEREGQHGGLLQSVAQKVDAVDQDIKVIKKRPRGKDRLTDIRGIGAVFAGLLNEAGVHTFQQLAALTPDELRNLVHVPAWRRIDADTWIEQAKLRASSQNKAEESI